MSSPTSALRSARSAAALLVLGCVVATFWRAIPGDLVFFQRDILGYWHPHVDVFVRAIRAGDVPLWNAYVGFGTPLLADPNFQWLYPPTWLVLLIPPADYYRLFVLGHSAFAGVGTLVLARRMGLPMGPAALAGGVFAVSGPLLSAASLFHHYAGAAWMPWVLAAFVALRQKPSPGAALGMAVAMVGQLLAGSADMCLMTALLGLGWLVAHERGPAPRAPWRGFARWLAVAVLAGGAVASFQWIPALSMVGDGARGLLSLEERARWSVHPAGLVDVFVPRLLSQMPWSAEARGVLLEGREPLLTSMFLGAPALGLAALGAFSPSRWRGFVLAAFGSTLLLSLGRFTPVFALVHAAPPLSLLRYPAKYLLPLALAWALLVGLGGAAWLERWDERQRRAGHRALWALVALGVALGAVALVALSPAALGGLVDPSATGPLRSLQWVVSVEIVLVGLTAAVFWKRARKPGTERRLDGVLAFVVLGDLVLAGQGINALAPRDLVESRPPVVAALPEGSRVHVAGLTDAQTAALFARSELKTLGRLGSALVTFETLKPPLSARYGLFGSVEDDFTGLTPLLQNALALVVIGREDWPVGRQGLRLAGVDYVVDVGRGLQDLDEVARFDSSLGVPVRVLQVRKARPRVYVVEGVRIVPDLESVETLITRTDLETEAVLSPGSSPREATPGFVATATIEERHTNRLVIKASTNRPGLLVVVEAYRDGWTATVDGDSTPVLRANGLFRGVALEPGTHRIEMTYRPSSVFTGAIVGSLGLLGLGALAFVARRRREGS